MTETNNVIATDDNKDAPRIHIDMNGDDCVIALSGFWTTHTVATLDDEIIKLEDTRAKNVLVDVKNITSFDTAGAWLVERLNHRLSNKNVNVTFEGIKPEWKSLLKSVSDDVASIENVVVPPRPSRVLSFFGRIGLSVIGAFHDFLLAMNILGSTIQGTQLKKGRGIGISIPAVVTQLDRMGVGAIPIICLMSSIVGAIIAQQGAFQLRNFGAEVYAVDLVGILVFRELGVLMTAIMIAGRSGSAITAEIGSMKMQEETDAMTVMGLNPIGVLVFPRLIALTIALPLLTVLADITAVIGAALILKFYIGMPFDVFQSHIYDSVGVTTFYAGLIKAPFMALIIGIIASVEGLKVGGSAESLGKRVTSSVVKAIFLVIIIDGFFAIFYAAIDF